MIGQTISHYKIIEKLGEGGMGVVYKAEDTNLKRIVALKFLPPLFSANDEVKQRFIHEAQAASALNHTNICSIHTIEEFENPAFVPHSGTSAGKQQFIDMEFVEGKTLGVLLKEKELSLKEVLDIALQIADGLNAAHKRGIIHRDIKPDNIMVTDENLVKIMDFGLAKLKGSSKLTKTHSTLGTLSYMSPEQARGEEVDQRSDIFSLGAVLYEMITGRRPFKGEHEAAIMYSLMNETPEPLARYKTSVPNEMQRIIDKALSKVSAERYQHVDEMIADLRRVQHGLSAGSITSTKKKSKILRVVTAFVLVVVVVGIYLFYPKSVPTSASAKTIAVLPFTNLSEDKGDEYFSDGITEDILTQLSKIADLNVISRTTIMQYKNTKKSLRDIGKELNAGVILEGSVRRSGDRIRISSQLIDAEADRHIWAENYDREMKDIFTIQSDVAQQIATALEAKISPAVKNSIEKKQTENTEAYRLYLKGRFYWNKRTAADLQKAIDCFNQAIQKDPTYALAHSALAETYIVFPQYTGFPTKEYFPRAEALAKRALELDENLAEPHVVLGDIRQIIAWDSPGAEREFKKAIELNPNYPTAHHWYSEMLQYNRRLDEAMREIKRAQELDPLSLVINVTVGEVLYYMRQYDDAIEQCKKTTELDENFATPHFLLGLNYFQKGMFAEAMKECEKGRVLVGSSPFGLGWLGYCYARSGKESEARKVLNELLAFSKGGYVVSSGVAIVYNGLVDKNKALEWLERACEERDMSVQYITVDPLLDNLRSEPRFIALLKKMGLEK